MVSTQAVIGDVVSPRERGRYSGLMGGVFGISTVIGPLLGGLIVDNLSWRWIFYVNLPIGIVAFVVLQLVLHTPRAARAPRDRLPRHGRCSRAGSRRSCSTRASAATTYAWWSAPMVVLLVLAVLLPVAFVLAERRAREPLVPAPPLPQPRLQRRERDRLHRRHVALRFGHLHPALPPGREGREPDRVGPAAAAADGGRARLVDRQRAADLAVRPLQGVPDRRHRALRGRDAAALAARHRHEHPRRRPLHGRARPRARLRDAGARARRPERRRLREPRRRHLHRDALPLDGRHDRRARLRRDLREPAREPSRGTASVAGDREAAVAPRAEPDRRSSAGDPRAVRRRLGGGASADLPARGRRSRRSGSCSRGS